MIGLLFFIWDSARVFPAMHAIWHFFVLGAAFTQYLAIRSVVSSLGYAIVCSNAATTLSQELQQRTVSLTGSM